MFEISEVVSVWADYVKTVEDWKSLVKDVEPKMGGCGLVYELDSPIGRPNESFAIADMRRLKLADPHYHANRETEIYFVLQGSGRIAVGSEIQHLSPGTTVVTPPETIHITLPADNLVLAVVNTPPFNINNYVSVDRNDEKVSAMLARLRTE